MKVIFRRIYDENALFTFTHKEIIKCYCVRGAELWGHSKMVNLCEWKVTVINEGASLVETEITTLDSLLLQQHLKSRKHCLAKSYP